MAEIEVADDRLQLVVPRGVEVWFDQRKLGVTGSEPYGGGVVLTLDPQALMALAPHPLFSRQAE